MRTVYAATIIAISILGASGGLLWKDYLSSRGLSLRPQQVISQIKNNFESKFDPVFSFNSEDIRGAKESKELIDPALVLPHSQKYPYAEIAQLYQFSLTCRGQPKIKDRGLQKALVWHQFVCGRREKLPTHFFSKPPYVHPSGQSYVKLALDSGRKSFASAGWISSHVRYAHILENLCSATNPCAPSSSPFFGAILTPQNLQSVLQGDDLIETPRYVLISHKGVTTDVSTRYLVFIRKSWSGYLEKQLATTAEGAGSPCLQQEGALCWIKNGKRDGLESLRLAILFTLGLLTLVGILLVQIIRKNIFQKRAARQRTFVLQMLTHEVRTPATALQLSLETLRHEFDSLPLKSQEAFLRICDQTQKLVRVIEASKKYLISDSHSKTVKFKTKQIPSINALFEALIEKYGDKVRLEKLAVDRHGNFDRHWIELCLCNLIENALFHGKPPVVIALTYTEKNLVIDVRDDGVLNVKSIDDLAVPFQKSTSSHGLGLGLTLVQKITKAMDGELTLSCSPTTFSMKIRDLI